MEAYNTIWDDVSPDVKREFDSKPVYNKKLLKTKIKFYDDETTDFHDKKIHRVGSDYICLAVNTIDLILKRDKNCYLQALFKECKNIQKEVIMHVIRDPDIYSDESDKE